MSKHKSAGAAKQQPDQQQPKQQQPKRQREGGEGNREADRKYRNAATEHARSGRSEPAAREAEEALDDDDEADELEQAEAEGKSRARSTHDQRGEED